MACWAIHRLGSDMFEDLRDYFAKLFIWRLPTTEVTITDIRIDQVTGRIAIYYQFSLGQDGPYTGVGSAEGELPLLTKKLDVGRPITVRYRREDPSINELDRDLSYLALTQDL